MNPEIRKFWREKLNKYGEELYFASAPTHVANPRWIEHLFSAVFERGIRTFAFKEEQQRKNFLLRTRQARICVNPCPLEKVDGSQTF